METRRDWEAMVRQRVFVGTILVALLSWSLATHQALGYGAEAGPRIDAGDGLSVAITRLDSESFPEMAAYVRVLGPDGSPLEDLTRDRLRVFEDGTEVPTPAITLLKDDSQAIDALLALDLNAPAETLRSFQRAAQAFVDAIGPRDRVALLAFHDAVEVVQPFTNSRGELQAAIEALVPRGTVTALNAAIYDAAAMADVHASGYTAVIILTDGGDDIDAPSRENAIDRARTAGVPVYVVALAEETSDAPGNLTHVTESTGGRAYVTSSPEMVEAGLLECVWRLRRGYQVRFRSSLPADQATHRLTVRVDHAEGSGQASAAFLAAVEAVQVTPLGISGGEVVSGVVELRAEVTAPAPVAMVEYLLNGESLGERYDPPYRFEWETGSLTPGDYTLTSKAIDSAGNRGLAHVGVRVVSRPSAPLGWLRWLRYLAIAPLTVIAIVAFIFSALLLFLLIRWQRTRYRQVCQVSVRNLGNAPSRYRLRAEEPTGALRFRFSLEGVDLHQRQIARVQRPGAAPPGQIQTRETGEPGRAEAPSPAPRSRATDRQAARGLEQAQERSRWLLGVSRVLADTLGAIGALLPSSLGAPLKRLSTHMRQRQSSIGRVERIPRQTISRAKKIPRGLSRIKPPDSSATPDAPEASEPSRPLSGARPSPPQAAGERRARAATAPARTVVDVWAQTPPVDPGDALALDLFITPLRRPTQDQSYTFRVTSRTMEQGDLPPVLEERAIQLEEVSWFRHALPFLAFGLLVVMEILVLGLLIRGIGLFG